jgi:hypothetical protein
MCSVALVTWVKVYAPVNNGAVCDTQGTCDEKSFLTAVVLRRYGRMLVPTAQRIKSTQWCVALLRTETV